MFFELYLPFPPSVNNYYKKSQAGGRFISEKGRWFRDEVIKVITESYGDTTPISSRMLFEVILFPPDKRKRDIDNYNKPLLDAITHSGFILDDSLIDQLFNYRGEVRSSRGSVYVRITDAGPILRDSGDLPID